MKARKTIPTNIAGTPDAQSLMGCLLSRIARAGPHYHLQERLEYLAEAFQEQQAPTVTLWQAL